MGYCEMKGFLSILINFDTMFLLRIFLKLFSQSDVLYSILLKTTTVDIVYNNNKVCLALFYQLQNDRYDGFETLEFRNISKPN